MIRRDYLLRMIEQFIQALARIRGLKREQQSEPAAQAIDEQFQQLLGLGAEAVSKLSETEVMALLLKGEPTQVVRDKCLMLVTLLREHADVLALQNRLEDSQLCNLKALQLLLQVLAQAGATELPEFVPTVDSLAASLKVGRMPLDTTVNLMAHYETTGEYAKAEDALFAMIETDGWDPVLVAFGLTFYERLLRESDEALKAGNLPREEVLAGLTQLREQHARPSP